MRSITVGMPSFRSPSSGFGISFSGVRLAIPGVSLSFIVLAVAVSVPGISLPVIVRMKVVVQLENPVPVSVIGGYHQDIVSVVHCLKPILHPVGIGLFNL
ncbi:MAG: hypothetical protein PUA70_00455 [Oribacterium sp.]|nr:hypothetical protein [Oribacterium sp.]